MLSWLACSSLELLAEHVDDVLLLKTVSMMWSLCFILLLQIAMLVRRCAMCSNENLQSARKLTLLAVLASCGQRARPIESCVITAVHELTTHHRFAILTA